MITLINHQGLKLVSGLQIQTPAPPLGLAYIGAYLRKHGYSYKGIDACGEALDQILPSEIDSQIVMQGLTNSQILERVPSDTTIFGFSCSFSHCWPLVVKIAEAVRTRFPDALFVTGGEHPTAMAEQVLQGGLFDVVVVREGEETILELIQKVDNNQSWHDIEGIAFMDGEKGLVKNNPRKRISEIDNFPYPDWDSWCIKQYIEYQQVSGINLGRSMPILGSRGCPYMCTFCSNECMWSRRYIMREGKSIVDEMNYMKNKYKINGFTFFDSTFIVNRDKTYDFSMELIKRDLNITYQLPAGTRCEIFNDNLSFLLERSGLRNFSFAPESGSEKIRNVIKKQISLDKLFHAIRAVKKTQMTIGCFIVIGFPEDSRTSMKETLSLVRKLAVMGVDDVTISKFTPYPCSKYFNDLQEKGYFSNEFNELKHVINFFSIKGRSYCNALTLKQTYHWLLWMYINFYVLSFILRPWRLIKNFWEYWSTGVEKTRYIRFFSDFFVNRRKWKKAIR
jgi:radical SAM superfamily enzyme YgiQ (UPF0313 family)